MHVITILMLVFQYTGELIQGFLIQSNHATFRDDARVGDGKYNQINGARVGSGDE